MLEDTVQVVVLIGIILGVASRTLIPYYNKLLQIGDLTFKWKYAITAAMAIMIAVPSAMEMFEFYIIVGTSSLWLTFLMAYIYGLGIMHVANEVVDKGTSAG